MALHGKQHKTQKQWNARANKPSRAKRIGRRWDGRVAEMTSYLSDRKAAYIENFYRDWDAAIEIHEARTRRTA